jgi:hypothetical protein
MMSDRTRIEAALPPNLLVSRPSCADRWLHADPRQATFAEEIRRSWPFPCHTASGDRGPHTEIFIPFESSFNSDCGHILTSAHRQSSRTRIPPFRLSLAM